MIYDAACYQSAIIGYSEIALMDAEKNTATEASVNNVLVAAKRARDLVAQILAFSRQGESEYKPVKISFVAREALKLMRATLPATIDIVEEIQSDANVMADTTQIHQVIMNLCTNAAHAMRSDGGVLTLGL